MVVAIVLGVVVGNAARLPAAVDPGLAVAAKQVLRIGDCPAGPAAVASRRRRPGAGNVFTVVAVVVGGIVAGVAIGSALGIDRQRLSLIACGFSICGAAVKSRLWLAFWRKRRKRRGRRRKATAPRKPRRRLRRRTARVRGHRRGARGHLRHAHDSAGAGVLGHLFGLDDMTIGACGPARRSMRSPRSGPSAGRSAWVGTGAAVIKLGRVLMLAPVMAAISIGERRRILAAGSGSGSGTKGNASGGVANDVAADHAAVRRGIPGDGRRTFHRDRSAGVIDVAGVAEQLFLGAAMFALGSGSSSR